MVGGINSRWKQVVAYHFTGAYVPGDTLRDFVFHLVRICEEISLRVLCVTCDMGSSNRAMWRCLNLSSSRDSVTVCSIPHPCDEKRDLNFMPDPAHVLKNIRRHLVRKDLFHLSNDIVSKFNLPTSVVSIQHVENVIQQQNDQQLKVAPGLSEIHVSNGHFTKMKVGIALQLFRESPAAIRYLIEKEKLPLEAETTAWFFEVVFRWYTLMTSRHPTVALSFVDHSKYEEAISDLNLATDVVRGMKIGVKKVWKPCQSGVLM